MSVVLRAVLIAAVFLALPASASARIVQCGEVITSDTRVDNDLRCETPVALQIGAHGVDLDLRGHTIEAIPFELPEGGIYDEGNGLVIPGYDDVSVANGTVIGNESLGYGLHATEAERLSLRRLSISGYASLQVTGDAARIVEVTARGFDTHIRSSGATIDELTTTTETEVFGQAVQVTNGDFRNITGFSVDGSSLQRNVITDHWNISGNGNSVSFNQGGGFGISGNDNSVSFNQGGGFGISGNDNSVVRNQGGRISLGAGAGNIVRGNRITQLVLFPGFSSSLIRDNIVSGSTGLPEPDGIHVSAGAADNVLLGNSASGAGDDGIDVEEASTTLTGNRAFANADLGIEAVAGVIDGGGNRAWDNGNPLQCLNVQCAL
jgi:hypothetical protein